VATSASAPALGLQADNTILAMTNRTVKTKNVFRNIVISSLGKNSLYINVLERVIEIPRRVELFNNSLVKVPG
jgi:hypothetical protein